MADSLIYYWLTPLQQVTAPSTLTHWHAYTKVKLSGQKEGLNPVFRFVRIRILCHMRTWVRSHYIVQDLSCQHPACSLCVVPCVLCLAGQKTIFPKSILSSLIVASACHCLSSCPSSFFLYALSHLLKASPSRLASSDVYRAPSMSVSVQNMGLCTLKMLYPVYSNKARALVLDR